MAAHTPRRSARPGKAGARVEFPLEWHIDAIWSAASSARFSGVWLQTGGASYRLLGSATLTVQ